MAKKPKAQTSQKKKVQTPKKKVTSSRKQPVARLGRTIEKLSTGSKSVISGKNVSLNPLSMYARCRIDPFSSPGSLGIPDTCGYRRIIVDYKGFCDINITGNCSAQILIMPGIPFTSAIKVSNSNSLSYVMSGNTVIPVASTDYTYSWYPLQVFPELMGVANAAPPAQAPNLYSADKARIVTLVTRLTYTGPALSPQGMTTVSSVPFSFQRGSGIATGNFTIKNTGGTDINQIGVNYFYVNTNIVPTLYTQDSVVHRPEVGDVIVAKHNGGDYAFKPLYKVPFVSIDRDAPSGGGGQYTFFGNVASLTSNGLVFIDEDWEGSVISLAGLANGMSFRLEQYLCVEYTPEMGSPFMRLAQVPPTASEYGLKAVDAVVKKMPVSVPLSQGTDPWYKTAARAISEIGSVILPFAKMLL